MNALNLTYSSFIGTGDLCADSGDSISAENWIKTAVYTSIFTNKYHPNTQEQGYWGDMFQGESYGSHLYTLARSKLYAPTIRRAKDYCRDALAWLVDDGHIKGLELNLSALSASRLEIHIVIVMLDGSILKQTEEYSFAA